MGKLLSEETLATFHDSLDRVLEHPGFFDRFYARFLRTPEIAEKFAGMDLARVKRLVRDSFYVNMMASDGNARAVARLETLAARHAANGVTQSMHDRWLEALLEGVRESDPRYDDAVERSWRDVIGISAASMKSRAPAA